MRKTVLTYWTCFSADGSNPDNKQARTPFVFNLNKFLIIWTLVLFPVALFAQARDIPVISCLEVHPNGGVTISWSNVASDVQQQNIFYSADGVSFNRVGQLDTYNPNISSYYHDAADAQIAIRYYYVEVVYPGETVNSDIARTMRLFAQPNALNAGIIELSWKDLFLPVLPYQIWQEVPVGHWSLIASGITRTLYNDTLRDAICNDTVTYRIEVENPQGCSSVSSMAGGWYSETRIPEPAVFDSLTVNADGFVVLSWSPSVSTDVESTIVYRNNFPVAEVPVSASFQGYIDSLSSPCDDPDLVYALAAADLCDNKSPIEDDQKLSPVFMEKPVGSVCESQVTLQWSPYINATPALVGYQVLFSLNGNPFQVAGEVDANTLVFAHQDVMPGTDYTYAIRAKFGTATSTSCQKVIRTGTYVVPQSVYLANASVRPDHAIDLLLDVDLQPIDCSWQVYRSDDATTKDLILSLKRDQVNDTSFAYTDTTADATTRAYTYEVVVNDSCGHERLISNLMTTVLLTGTKVSDQEFLLEWSPFSGYEAGIEYYRIYRDLKDGAPLAPIDSVASSVLEYTDNLDGIALPVGLATYWVEAVERDTNIYGYREMSESNRVTLSLDSELFMPNAFRPDGLTPVFKPVFTYFNGPNYLFRVYNRWGQLIFETKEATQGWDGRYLSQEAPAGSYVYHLVFTTSEGKQTERYGSFFLVR